MTNDKTASADFLDANGRLIHRDTIKNGSSERRDHSLTLSAILEIYGPAGLLQVLELAGDPQFVSRIDEQNEHAKKMRVN